MFKRSRAIIITSIVVAVLMSASLIFIVRAQQLESINFVPQATAPITCDTNSKGAVYFDSGTNSLFKCNGTTWANVDIDTNTDIYWTGTATNLVDTTARTSLGLVIGTNVQAYDADLADLADGTLSASKVQYGNLFITAAGTSGQVWKSDGTDAGAWGTDIDSNTDVYWTGTATNLTASTARTSLGLVIGTNVQAYDADLADLADGTLSASKVQYGANFITTAGTSGQVWKSDGSGVGVWGTDIDTNTDVYWTGTATNLTASTARTSLGLVIGTNVQAYDADLADLADGTLSASKVQYSINSVGTSGQVWKSDGSDRGAWGTDIDSNTDVYWTGTATNLVAATGRSSLGLVIGTNVQAYDADLADLADGSLTATKVQYGANFITAAGTSGQVWKSDGTGAGVWGTDNYAANTNTQCDDADCGSLRVVSGGNHYYWGAASLSYRTFMGNSDTYDYGDVTDYHISTVMNNQASRGFTWGPNDTTPTVAFEVNSGDAFFAGTLTVGGGTGKINAGTVDPIYTVGGTRYATYMAGMTGVKEETTATITLSRNDQCQISNVKSNLNVQCAIIDFDEVEVGSDLWLFAQTVNVDGRAHISEDGTVYRTTSEELFNKMSVLLTPAFEGDVWYKKDAENKRIVIYAQPNTQNLTPNTLEVSYRLTAPRFDWKAWGNTTEDDVEGFNLDKLLQ